MNQCPYPERNHNRVSGNIETNRLYFAWHEGYEAHKFNIEELKIKLEKQGTKL